MNDIDEIKSRLDIVDIVSDYVELRRSGHNHSGFCPFHPNSRTPAFYVFPETQTWRCFGACAEGGDIFSFVMKKEGWDFKEALKELAARAGVQLKPLRPINKKKQAADEQKFILLDAAADYFHQLLLYAPEAKAARAYLKNRGLNAETIAAFRLGYALPSWDACRTHFSGQGYSDEDLLGVGVLTHNPDKGTTYDRFRNRFMIPIRNLDGRVIGFGARTMEKDGIPKYLNSPQTAVFDKSGVLYGLSSAKRHIREARQVVIVEGYMDVIQAWQGGFRNVVAQMGTALTERQLTMLKRYTKRFILALDADAAGQKATMRGLQVARETLDRESVSTFDARGLVKHEGRLKADIRIISMPDGKDPDNIIAENPSEWTKLLAEARPVVEYVISMATADLDMSDAKAKTAVAQQVIPLIKDISEPVERDHYWQALAQALKVDERALRLVQLPEKRRPFKNQSPPRQTVKKTFKKQAPKMPPYQSPPSPNQPPPPPDMPPDWDNFAPPPMPDEDMDWEMSRGIGEETAVAGTILGHTSLQSIIREKNYLRQCFRHPALVAQINHKLKMIELNPVRANDFTRAEDRALYTHLHEHTMTNTVATIDELYDTLSEPLLNRIQTIQQAADKKADSEQKIDANRLADKLTMSICDWRLAKVKQLIEEIRSMHSTPHQEGGVSAIEMNRLMMRMLKLNRAKSNLSTASSH